MHLTYLLLLIHWINASILRIFEHWKHIDMLTRKRIRKTNVDESTANKKTEKADSEKSENKIFRKTENQIIRMIKKAINSV